MNEWTVDLFGFPISFGWFSLALPLYAWWIARQIIGGRAEEKDVHLVGRLSVVTALLLLGSIAIHEMGHALVSAWLGTPVNGAGVMPVGAYIRHEPTTPGNQLLISLAGPATQLVASLMIAILAKRRPKSIYRVMWLAVAHLSAFVALINLLPIGPLDGNHAYNAILELTTDDASGLLAFGPVLTVLLVVLWIKLKLSWRLYSLYQA